MLNLLSRLSQLLEQDTLFWICALSGSGMFLIQLMLSFFGGIDQEITEGSHQADWDAGKFNWLSTHALWGFILMFGWIGLTCRKQFNMGGLSSASISFLGGVISFFLTTLLFKIAKKLKSRGVIFRVEDILGKDATVYQRIPKEGSGKISLPFNDLTYEVDATSFYQEEIASFSRVHIIKKVDEKTVSVALASGKGN